ncbi:MAG TPA: lactate utilization protein [Thermomicrobiales bacterium]|nr:lactate utilization protein [Thermomicrobiales bacterium]
MTETSLAPTDALYRQLEAALAKVGGVCHRAADIPFAAEAIENIMGGSDVPLWTAPMVRDALPALLDTLEGAGVRLRYPTGAVEVRDQAFGLSVARQAIAETGSVVLVERELTDRAVGLVTETHIVICPLDALAPSLDDAGETLAAVAQEHGSYATLVTGPSRTADIERQLTVGVQGPARLHLIVIDTPA